MRCANRVAARARPATPGVLATVKHPAERTALLRCNAFPNPRLGRDVRIGQVHERDPLIGLLHAPIVIRPPEALPVDYMPWARCSAAMILTMCGKPDGASGITEASITRRSLMP